MASDGALSGSCSKFTHPVIVHNVSTLWTTDRRFFADAPIAGP